MRPDRVRASTRSERERAGRASPERGSQTGLAPADDGSMSATDPQYGLPTPSEVAVRPRSSNLIPLLVVFVGLSVAAIWFVARPALATPSTVSRACDRVVVHASGTASCVTNADRVVRVG